MGSSVERRPLLVASTRRESDSVVSLQLVDPEGSALPAWTPGAHVEIELDNGLIRHYSLCGAVEDASSWRIAVLLEPKSRGGSRYIHDELRPGHIVQLRRLRNQFPLGESGEYIFIAGGIGITPILPMIQHAQASRTPYTLFYCGRSRSNMAFVDELSQNSHARIIPFDTDGVLDVAAVLDATDLNSSIYCCGPAPLIDAVKTNGARVGVSVHVESFRAGQPEVQDSPQGDRASEGQTVEDEFEIVLARSRVTLPVPRNRSILEILELNGIPQDFSCREGTCGTCETTVLAGLPDHRDSVLDDDEKAANDTMMLCVSRSLSKRLTLDL